MPYANIDDNFADHPKVVGISDAAFRLHVAGILYCRRHQTDGLIEADEVPRLVRRFKKSAVPELVEANLWHERFDGKVYEIHDFLDWNESRNQVEKRRADKAKRMEEYRKRQAEGAA